MHSQNKPDPVDEGLRTVWIYGTVFFYYVRRHVRRDWKIVLGSLIVWGLLLGGISKFPTTIPEKKGLGAVALGVLLFNLVWLAWREQGQLHVHALSYQQALERTGMFVLGKVPAPRLLHVRSYPSGAVELTVTPEFSEERWQSSEMTSAFCSVWGLPGFRKVFRDEKNRIHLILAPHTFSKPTESLAQLESFVQAHPDQIPLGIGALGMVVWSWRQVPHVILGGTTGSGKSTLLRLMIALLLKQGARVYLVDVKRGLDYLPLLPDLAGPVQSNSAEALSLLEFLWQEFEDRLKALHALGFPSLEEAHRHGQLQDLPETFLAIDEFSIFARSETTKAAKEIRAQALQIVESLAQGGRAVGIHLILSLQYPTSEVLGSQIKQQALRITGRLEDKTASETVLGVKGAESIFASTPGRFLYKDGPDIETFQAYSIF